MCGIAGYFDKTGNDSAAIGAVVLKMLEALGARGPDSAGVALYGGRAKGEMVLRIKVGENGSVAKNATRLVAEARKLGKVSKSATTAEYLRLALKYQGDPKELERRLESVAAGVEIVSMGRRLEIVKQVGSPQNLDATYGIAKLTGTHGIGHTRLCTESKVDLSHSQPFWAHGCPDLAVVHNGHITNYHKLRRLYEQRGHKFYTENDSEVIGMYLADQMARGLNFRQALEASLKDLDGSFSYLAADGEHFGFAKDVFAFKPLLFTETDKFVAVATEEVALHAGLTGDYHVREAQAGEVRVWER